MLVNRKPQLRDKKMSKVQHIFDNRTRRPFGGRKQFRGARDRAEDYFAVANWAEGPAAVLGQFVRCVGGTEVGLRGGEVVRRQPSQDHYLMS